MKISADSFLEKAPRLTRRQSSIFLAKKITAEFP